MALEEPEDGAVHGSPGQVPTAPDLAGEVAADRHHPHVGAAGNCSTDGATYPDFSNRQCLDVDTGNVTPNPENTECPGNGNDGGVAPVRGLVGGAEQAERP